MIDYQAISDADPGGDLQAAFAALSAETISVLRGVDERMLSARGVYGIIGKTAGKAALDAIKAGEADDDVKAWFSPSEGGIDSFLIGPTFQGLADGGVITQAEADLVISYAYTIQPKFPGLTIAQIDKARMKKARGDF